MTAPTPSLREAAQMALDALNCIGGKSVCNEAHHKKADRHSAFDECPVVKRFDAATEALSTTLALHDKPVLYRYQGSESVIPVMPGYSPGPGWTPLYAHQPAPLERQPLTDDQIEDMRGDANRGSNIEREDYFKAVRDAEAAHGIRGAA